MAKKNTFADFLKGGSGKAAAAKPTKTATATTKKKPSTGTSKPPSKTAARPSTSRSASTSKNTTANKPTAASRTADAKRYAKNPAKRIAAEKKYQAKEKAQHPEIFKARAKVNNAKRDGKISGPTGSDFHHTSYNSKEPKGKWMPQSKHRRLPNSKVPRTK